LDSLNVYEIKYYFIDYESECIKFLQNSHKLQILSKFPQKPLDNDSSFVYNSRPQTMRPKV